MKDLYLIDLRQSNGDRGKIEPLLSQLPHTGMEQDLHLRVRGDTEVSTHLGDAPLQHRGL